MADLIISLAEVETHGTEDDCWIVIDNMVLDVTKFLDDFPGSKQGRYISGFAGRDATVFFNDACNTDAARKMLTKYKIGVLPEEDSWRLEQAEVEADDYIRFILEHIIWSLSKNQIVSLIQDLKPFIDIDPDFIGENNNRKYNINGENNINCHWNTQSEEPVYWSVEDPEVECVLSEVECVLPEVDPPSEEVVDPEVECVLPEVECVLPEMEMTKKDSKKKDGCGCAIMWSREKFRLQLEGTKNIFKSLFLAVGSYNLVLKKSLKNFQKISNNPSV